MQFRQGQVGRKPFGRLAHRGGDAPRIAQRVGISFGPAGQLEHATQPHHPAGRDAQARFVDLAPQPLAPHAAQGREAHQFERLLRRGRERKRGRAREGRLRDAGFFRLTLQRRCLLGALRKRLDQARRVVVAPDGRILRRARLAEGGRERLLRLAREPLLQRRLLLVGRGRLARVAQHRFAEEALDHRERAQFVDWRFIDHLAQRAPPVGQLDHAVDLVGQIGEPRGERREVDHQDAGGRHGFQHAADLVEPPHAFHEQALGAAPDARVAIDRPELDPERAGVPVEQPVERSLADERPDLGIDHLPVAHPDLASAAFALAGDGGALLPVVERLEEIDQPQIAHRARQRCRRFAVRVLRLIPLGEQHAHALNQFLDQERLAEEVVGPRLDSAGFDGRALFGAHQ